MLPRGSAIMTGLLSAGWCLAVPTIATAGPIDRYIEAGGVVTGEAELYSNRTAITTNNAWRELPSGEGTSAGTFSNFRGTGFVQNLLDDGAGATGPTTSPFISYRMDITTTGTYRLFLRWGTNNTDAGTRGASDSLFADIVELKDGAGGSIADWYEYANGSQDGDFSTNPWDGTGGFEQNSAGITGVNAVWNITTPGIYTLRLTVREDGSALDAFVFQLSNLAAPTGNGPATSTIVPVPEPAGIGALAAGSGLIALGLRRFRRRAA